MLISKYTHVHRFEFYPTKTTHILATYIYKYIKKGGEISIFVFFSGAILILRCYMLQVIRDTLYQVTLGICKQTHICIQMYYTGVINIQVFFTGTKRIQRCHMPLMKHHISSAADEM